MNKRYAMAEVKALDGGSDPNGEFEVILSAPTLDRDGEVLETGAFDPLPPHITFDIDHGMTTATTVASGVPRYEDGFLKVRGTFSSIPRAQEVRTLVREGHIRTTSVAYMAAQYEQKDGTPHLVKGELLNGAFVPIPSNRESVVLSAKSYAEKLGPAGGDLAAVIREAVEKATRPRAAAVKGHGMTANDLRDAVSRAVEAAHGGDRRWTWLRDYTDEWAVFDVDGMEPTGTFKQPYTVTERVAAMSGDPVAVVARTVYDEISTTDSTPGTAAAAAKSPASAVAHARAAAAAAELFLLDH